MKNINLLFIAITILVLSFSSCSKKPDPYYDRANQAAQKAHNKLDKE